MGRRKQKKRRQRRAKTRTSNRGGPVFFKHPFAEIPRERLRTALVEHAKASERTFQDTLDEILRILRTNEPLQAIAMLAVFGLFGAVTDEGKRVSLSNDRRFTQAHAELAQALSLTIPRTEIPINPPNGPAMQQLFELLPKVGDAFAHRRLLTFEQERSDEQKAITLVQELLRAHTQIVRNWAYFDQVQRIVHGLYSPLNDAFVRQIGLSATQLATAFLRLIRDSEQKVTNALRQLPTVFAARTVDEVIRKYYGVNPEFNDTPDEMIALASRERFTVEQTKALVLSHFEYRLAGVYEFSAESVASQLGVAPERVKEAFDRLSLSFGDLASHPTDHLFLDNPVWRKPVIRIGTSRYFCAIPQAFFSFVRPIVDDLVAGNPLLERACEQRRADFLEGELVQIFQRAFPGAEIVGGFRWREGDREYENDLLVRIDSHLLLIEAKSGTVSWPALRGAPERARKHIEDLLIAPSVQSARLAERLKTVLNAPNLRDSLLPGLDVRLDQVHTVLRLSVTLEDFAMIQANLGELKRTGWLPQDHDLAPCMLLTDLEIVLDILEPIGQKLHYLRRRTELAARMTTMGDEVDYLGLYLGTGFNLGEAEFSGVALQLVGMSKAIDEFCVARAEGLRVAKPNLRVGKWWSDICAHVERRAFYRWTDVYNVLLSLSSEEQDKAEGMFERIKKGLRTSPKSPSRKDSVLITPSPRKPTAIALYAFRDADSPKRHERMQSVASQAFEHPGVERCLVVAVNIERAGDPYASLAIFSHGDNAGQSNLDDVQVY